MNHHELEIFPSSQNLQSPSPSAVKAPCTRRQFAKWSLSALPGVGLFSALDRLNAAESAPAKPNSKFAGVQVGLNVPYSFANMAMSGDEILKNCLHLGLSAVELRTQPVEAFLGLSADLLNPRKGAEGSAASRAAELAQWRTSVSVDGVKEFRKKYEDATESWIMCLSSPKRWVAGPFPRRFLTRMLT